MRTLKLTLTFSIIFPLIFSCGEDVLEKSPIDFLDPETFYSDARNLKTGLYGIYNNLQKPVVSELSELDGISDNSTLTKFDLELVEFSKGIVNDQIDGALAEYYKEPYEIIQRSNLLLDHINIAGPISDESRASIEAEARALRAFAYFNLAMTFGDIPLVLTSLDREGYLTISQSSQSNIIDFVLEELTFAGNALNTEPFNGESGRLTKQAVLALKARILLFQARLGNKDWTEALMAIETARDIAETAGATLFTLGDGSDGYANFESLFLEANESNQEGIWVVPGTVLSPNFDVWQRYAVLGGGLGSSVNNDLIDDFYTIDGLPISDPSSIYDASDPYSNRDPRFYVSVNYPGGLYSNGLTLQSFNGQLTQSVLETDFAQRKLTMRDGVTPNRGTVDVMLIRFAELLLMFAEAENEVNGPTSDAYNAIDQVSTRAGMPTIGQGLSQDEFRSEVIHERRIELAFEGLRWLDLVTLNLADTQINKLNTLGRAFVTGVQERFPIPASEIDLNPNLIQNPGY